MARFLLLLLFILPKNVSSQEIIFEKINSYPLKSNPKILNEFDGKLFFYSGYGHHIDFIDLSTEKWDVIDLDLDRKQIYDTILSKHDPYGSLQFESFAPDVYDKYSIEIEFIKKGKSNEDIIIAFTIPIKLNGTKNGYPSNYNVWIMQGSFIAQYNLKTKKISLNYFSNYGQRNEEIKYFSYSKYLFNNSVFQGVLISGESKKETSFFSFQTHSKQGQDFLLDSLFYKKKWTDNSWFSQTVNPYRGSHSLSTNPVFIESDSSLFIAMPDTIFKWNKELKDGCPMLERDKLVEFLSGKRTMVWVTTKGETRLTLFKDSSQSWIKSFWDQDKGYFFVKTSDSYVLNKYYIKP